MTTKFKNRILFITGSLILLVAFAFWYNVTYSMEMAESKEINNPTQPSKVLIATQGSDFKKAIVDNIIAFYKMDAVYIKVMDVSQLPEVDVTIYDAVILLHTWEYGKPPKAVTPFLKKNKQVMDKIIVIATSGAGTNKVQGFDAMVGESILENASDISDEIIEKMQKLLQ